MLGDLPLYPPSSFENRMARHAEGWRPVYSTIQHSITFAYLPNTIWLRQERADVLDCGELREAEFLFWPLSGGIPCLIGRQVGWWREVAVDNSKHQVRL
jgi:hypothetical protein